jgi:pimeloyl-ACP methyl ester carboxylesterase
VEALDARVDAFQLCDPAVFDAAIAGEVFAGYDADAPIACPLVVLRADPAMGPAFFPEHEARLRRAAPQARIHEIDGAPHGIHYDRDAGPRYLAHLDALLAAVPA